MKRYQASLSGALKLEFQKDLELFTHFLSLLNSTGPIRNVELMWHEELEPLKLRLKNRVGTRDALVQFQPAAAPETGRTSPSALFCDLVHGFGGHKEETCTRSDVPAMQRCQETGCTQVYECHLGLTDIAVPVICDGEYLGTLFSGRVLTSPQTPDGFRLIRAALAGQPPIDFESLEAAYYRVPVVDEGQVEEMVRVLELFARYIANSWKRLQLLSDFQRKHDRELMLDRKELASILLSGDLGNLQDLNSLVIRAGLSRLPERVMVLQIELLSTDSPHRRISPTPTLNRVSHMVADFCQSGLRSPAMVVRPGEVCVFICQDVRTRGQERISLQEMGESILSQLRSHGNATARIGVSDEHPHPAELVKAYEEACASLGSSASSVSFFNDSTPQKSQPTEVMARLVKAVQHGRNASSVTHEFLALVMPSDHSATHLQQSQALLTWAIEHLALETVSVGADPVETKSAKEKAITGVLRAPNPFRAGEAFRSFADSVCARMASAFSQREHKLVLTVRRLVEERGPAQITIQHLSQEVHLSSGHLSRVFRRTTGMTLEQFLIRQRVELAKRALLDLRLNIEEVARLCGFCSSGYFASVFKKYVNCTPREFATQPHHWEPLAPASGPRLTSDVSPS